MSNQLSRYGAIAKALPFTPGRIFFVFGSETAAGAQEFINAFPADEQGVPRVFTGSNALATAYSFTTSDRDDVIVLMGSATHTLTSMLSITKSRVHIVGSDYLLGIHRDKGQTAKVSLGVTTATSDIGTISITGSRCSLRGVKIINDNTLTEALYALVDGGEYTYIEDVEVYKSTKFDVTGAAELVANGDSSIYKNMYIGTTVTAVSGAIIRPCVTFSRQLAGSGKVARDVLFDNVTFARKCGNTANRFVYGAEATAIERLAKFNDCTFWNTALATAVPAQNVAFGSTQTDGSVLLNNCVAIGAGTAMSTTTGVFVYGAVPAAGTSGKALQATT